MEALEAVGTTTGAEDMTWREQRRTNNQYANLKQTFPLERVESQPSVREHRMNIRGRVRDRTEREVISSDWYLERYERETARARPTWRGLRRGGCHFHQLEAGCLPLF